MRDHKSEGLWREHFHSSVLLRWEVLGWIIASLLAVAGLLLAFEQFTGANVCFGMTASFLFWKIIHAAIVSNDGFKARALFTFILCGLVGVAIVETLRGVNGWVAKHPNQEVDPGKSEVIPSYAPSLLFVFGAPLGDNVSARWVMLLKHYGPATAYNCEILFYDNDRKNIEHQWLVKHPDSPYPPPGLAGESQRQIHVDEANPEGSAGNFIWSPLDPNSQHYTVSISCRDGVFVENWEITRVDGILRSKISIERGPVWIQKNPNREPVVFRYEDPEFVATPLAAEIPKTNKGKIVHPGWKPNFPLRIPTAIIDPNGNVQVLSGVPAPDGSKLTDFGSWNILTRHFGDDEGQSK
jgi:hypothetical protein